LWDYHPYKSNWKVPIEETDASNILVDCIEHMIDSNKRDHFKELKEKKRGSIVHHWGDVDESFQQLSPIDKYKGGYWYKGDVRGRYLHVMCLKSHLLNEEGYFDRYNYIVHPLAFRAAINRLPDDSVDGMQWCIANINNESHFADGPREERLSKWGDRCHGLEIFNDFTLFYSWQPRSGSDGSDGSHFNGQLANYKEDTQEACYHYTYNSYPLEFGEFLLDYALTMGTYLHPISASDAFFNRKIIPVQDLEPDAEGMERVLLSDPKGVLVERINNMVWQSGCQHHRQQNEKIQAHLATKPGYDPEGTQETLQESLRFTKDLPYGESNIFGYTPLKHNKKGLRQCMEDNPASNSIYECDDDWKTGLNVLKHSAYVTAKASFKTATKAFELATGAHTQAVTEAKMAVETAKKLRHQCLCKKKSEHEKVYTVRHASAAANLKAWVKAHQIICVLDDAKSCRIPGPPVVTRGKLYSAAKEAQCSTIQPRRL
jgi:hypothetical protein